MPNSHASVATIPAAHNLTIEIGPDIWRLINGTRSSASGALVEATAQGISYSPAFARARRLPPDGKLAPPDIARVVIGWAPETQSWHLGLLLATPDSGQRPWRWCGLASWSGKHTEHEAEARQAAQALARLLDRPLHVVSPPRPAAPQVAPRPAAPPAVPAHAEPPLRTPPLHFGEWSFVAHKRGLAWRRRSGWIVGAAVRAVGLLVMALVFLFLGVGTLTSGLAQVNPAWLPWLGLAVALTLIALALHTFWQIVSVTDVIVDVARREVRARRRFSGTTRWRVPFDRVAYVLLSQTTPRPQGRKGKDGPMRVMQEMWVHLADGEHFWPVVALGQVEGTAAQWDEVRARLKKAGRRRVRLGELDTPAHHAAIHMARALGTPLWWDIHR
ncbi:MAG: hypothetical protein Kow00106_06990 [Anaerolineae bacterium]